MAPALNITSSVELASLSKSFGGLTAVNGVTLKFGDDQITGVIGPNGAGKTTLFNLIAGSDFATRGSIYFQGRLLERRMLRLQAFSSARAAEILEASGYGRQSALLVADKREIPEIERNRKRSNITTFK
jgi:ABC-type branched-subunit amino acid transport system ATPase component